MSKLSKKLLFSSLFLLSTQTFAASCCGGGFAVPSIITGDDKAQVTTSLNYSQIDTDVLPDGVWLKRNSQDTTQLYKIEFSHIFADRFQAGATLPVQMHTRNGASGGTSTGLADVSAQLGYEFLPDWNYNPIRPKGVGFISISLPTGKSIYESDNGLDSRGRGFLTVGAGAVFTKNWVAWDANSSLEVHHSFSKVVSNSQILGTIEPNNGGSFSLGAGYNIGDTRIGTGIAWAYEDAINVSGSSPSNGSSQKYATGSMMVSRMFNDLWAATVSYSDQTLFGEPSNTTLSKTVSLSLQKRWPR